MKKTYQAPSLTIEDLINADVLMLSNIVYEGTLDDTEDFDPNWLG